jgi:uncharacterized protein YehS (DUF1456 family)
MLNYLYLLQVTNGVSISEADFSVLLREDENTEFNYCGEELFDKKFEIML